MTALLCTLLCAEIAAQAQSVQPRPGPRPLSPGQPQEMRLASEERHDYLLQLEAYQFARIVVNQIGIATKLTVVSPDGAQMTAPDNPNGWFGEETIFLAPSEAGAYLVSITPRRRNPRVGSYQIELKEQRLTKAEDSFRMAAQREFIEAVQLKQQGTAESQRQALEKFRLIRPLWNQTGESRLELQVINYIGMTYLNLGEANHAVEIYQEALALSRAGEIQHDVMQALGNLADAYQQMGEPRLSLDRHLEELALINSLGDFQREALTRNSIGSIYVSLGEPSKAIDSYQRALGISQEHGLVRNEGAVLSQLGAVNYSIGEYQKALDYFHKSRALLRQTSDVSGEATTLNSIGRVYLALGEYGQALDFFTQALDIGHTIGNRALVSKTLNNLGRVLMFQGNLKRAREYFNQALEITRKDGTRPEEAESLSNLGAVHKANGEMEKALGYYESSLLLCLATEERAREAMNAAEIGGILTSRGEWKAASSYLQQALQLSQDLSDRRLEAYTLYQFARLSQKRGDFLSAIGHLEKAIEMIETLRTKFALQDMRAAYLGTVQNYYQLYIETLMDLSRRPDDEYAAKALQASEMARARSLLELIVESRTEIRQGISPKLTAREKDLQQQIEAKREKLQILRNKRENPRLAADIQQEISALLADLGNTEAHIRQESPAYAAITHPHPLYLAQLQEQVLDENTLLLEYSLGESRSYLWTVGKSSFMTYELPGRAEIEKEARRIYDLMRNRPYGSPAERQAGMAAFVESARHLSQMLLGPAAAELGRHRLIVVSDGALQYVPFSALPLPEGKQEGDETTGRRGDGGTERGSDGKTAIQENEAMGRKTRPVAQSPSRPVAYTPLLVRHEIIGLPSATTLAVLRNELKGRKPAAHAVAVFADPVFGKYDDRLIQRPSKVPGNPQEKRAAAVNNAAVPRQMHVNGQQERSGESEEDPPAAADAKRNSNGEVPGIEWEIIEPETLVSGPARIARLAYSRDEADAILGLAPPDQTMRAVDFDASRATVMNPALGEYRILHFATHGLFDSENPEQSGLIFSTIDERGVARDGLLRLNDIYNLKLPAEMVVLSACQSGLGRQIKGEGVIGLTRGFMHAGARRVVASLWKINDAATAELMKRFYLSLLGEQQLAPAAALRQAQLAMWSQSKWQAPYFWAAFVLQGEW